MSNDIRRLRLAWDHPAGSLEAALLHVSLNHDAMLKLMHEGSNSGPASWLEVTQATVLQYAHCGRLLSNAHQSRALLAKIISSSILFSPCMHLRKEEKSL
jgi:hypothetical protein